MSMRFVAAVGCSVISLGFAAECAPQVTAELRVNPSSKSKGSFASLEDALSAARNLPPPRNVTINIQASCRLSRGLVLSRADSCLQIVGDVLQLDSPMGGDHLTYDVAVPASAVELLTEDTTEPETWRRIQPQARGHVYSFDYRKLNLKNVEQWPDAYNVGDPSTTTFGLYYAGRKLSFSRSPKVDEDVSAQYSKVRCMNREKCVGGIPMAAALNGTSKAWLNGDHTTPSAFSVYEQAKPFLKSLATAVSHGLYLEGNWRVDFEVTGARVKAVDIKHGIVQFAKTMPGGVGWKYVQADSGCGCEPFYAVNALELISQELEYALDWKDGRVYVYLPSANGQDVDVRSLLTVTDSSATMIRLEGAKNVTLEGIRMGYSLGTGVEVVEGRDVALKGLHLHDLGLDGVAFVATENSEVRSCDIHNIGNRGILVSGGGDVDTLTPSNVSVLNNHMWSCGLNGILFGEGVSIINGSVGARIAHNLIHHISGQGIHGGHDTSVHGMNTGVFDLLVEYNEVFQVGLNGSGFGAIYTCCNPVDGAGGTYRYNFVHSSPNVNAIAWDNQLSGQQGYGNVIYYMQNGFGLNHGSFNSMVNNLIVRTSPKPGATEFQAGAGISIACRGFHDVYNCSLTDHGTKAWLNELAEVHINDTSSAWGERFKWYLGGICEVVASDDGKNQWVVSNLVDSNAMIEITTNYSNKGCNDDPAYRSKNNTFGATFQTQPKSKVDPGFVDYSKLNFTLHEHSIIYKALPSFKPIPFNDIGISIDKWRAVLPTDEEIGRLIYAPKHQDDMRIEYI